MLENINSPEDVKKFNIGQMQVLAEEIRKAILNRVSTLGGHCSPNLGIVEATIAMHYVFNSPEDKIIFDVSHQCYAHKILTGRKEAFLKPEHYSDVSGFSNCKESLHDMFTIGHTSTSISLALGLAKARDLKGEKFNVIAFIGDGSLSGGEALEGLNIAGEFEGNLIIIVNDNDMSIPENHGGLYKNLKLLRDTEGKAELNIFKAMGLEYTFVKDGNNISDLISAFKHVKDSKKPIAVHICTIKGKGYPLAEQYKEKFHACGPFYIETGKQKFPIPDENYSAITNDFLMAKMKKDKTLFCITCGTPVNMGFTPDKRKQAGKQFIDLGIAEESAVALASGAAKAGGKPVWGVMSSFIQRTYDQLSQDLCMNKSPAVILNFWASINGMKDITHLGIFDIPFLSNIPNMVYLAPFTKEEYLSMLNWALEQRTHPVAIRVPIDVISEGGITKKDWGNLNKYEITSKGSKIAIIGLGNFYGLGKQTAAVIEKQLGFKPTLINPYYISGVDYELLESLKTNHKAVITLEDGILDGGFGEKIARFYGSSEMKVLNYGFKKEFIDRFKVEDILKVNRLTLQQIAEDIAKIF